MQHSNRGVGFCCEIQDGQGIMAPAIVPPLSVSACLSSPEQESATCSTPAPSHVRTGHILRQGRTKTPEQGGAARGGGRQTYRFQSLHHLVARVEALHQRARGHERALQLLGQLGRHIPERLQTFHVGGHALQVPGERQRPASAHHKVSRAASGQRGGGIINDVMTGA